MIKIENADFKYAVSDEGALNHVSLSVGDGECILLCGESGCGKTTLTRLINGLIPHYYEGNVLGNVSVNDSNVLQAELYETAKNVGSVFQNPRSQFFCVDTTSEMAFGCENLGLPEAVIEERIAQTTHEFGIVNLLRRNIFHLSGGEKQKIACASVSTMETDILVLDEPTSNLDVDAIESLKRILLLWKAKGKTIIIAEHRLYWLKEICDRVVIMQNGTIEEDIPMRDFLQMPKHRITEFGLRTLSLADIKSEAINIKATSTLELKAFRFSYENREAMYIEELILPADEIIAVIGHNGAGKSTFSRCLCGLERDFRGTCTYDGVTYNRKKMLHKCYMVMQDVNHQLFCETVQDEVELGMVNENKNDVAALLKELDLDEYKERHPMSLSGGQKQRTAIASAILAEKEILVFDEPTSGLDFKHMEQTAQLLKSLAGRKTVFIVTHDPEFIVRCCSYVLHLENGKVYEQYALDETGTEKLTDYFMLSGKEGK